ncbi:uncharacterized protein NPIL_118781 [Nephila pilipes]|uniref:DUF7041 domain-containing protein n=1 Tax=Nephila pilipes TaxID=299642 RepID=A0A8X6N4U2_NEPPI|nr:uncharacterized protein NPIL_118781 [Nephila pilipes]
MFGHLGRDFEAFYSNRRILRYVNALKFCYRYSSFKMDENKSDPTALNFDNPNTEINRVAVKPPIFWRNKPKLWFLQLEAQFANSGISQDATKYNIVVAALDENVLDFVVDILSNPPENEKYDTLKKALLNRLTDTEESRLKKLLTDLELGDKRPSDLLRQMKSLAGNSISDEIIKSLWLQRLPQQTQVILTISNDTLDKIAEMADKIIAVYSSSEICQATKVGSLPNSASSFDRNKLDVLQADIAALTKKFDEFSRNTRSRSKSRGNDRRRSRSNSARYEFCCSKAPIMFHPHRDRISSKFGFKIYSSLFPPLPENIPRHSNALGGGPCPGRN